MPQRTGCAVDLMTVTAHMLHDHLPEVPLIEDDRLLCQRLGERSCTLFGPGQWLRHSEPNLPGKKLPTNWQVTSDSIAARLAITLLADEVVLLKSALPKNKESVGQLVQKGYLDRMFAALHPDLPRTFLVNLRDPDRGPLRIGNF